MEIRTARAKACAAVLGGLLLTVSFVLFPAPARAKTTVGVIMTGDTPYYQQIHRAFMVAISGKADVRVVLQEPAPEPMAWANAARKLVSIGSDILVVYGAPATLTAMKQTSSLPIVFAGVYDPRAMNITGMNAAGISSQVDMAFVLRLLKEIKDFKKLGIIFNKTEKDTILQVKEAKALEGTLGYRLVLLDAGRKGYTRKMAGLDAVLLTTSCRAMCNVDEIVNAARTAGVPMASTIGGGEKIGIILTVSADAAEQGRAAAEMVLQVLRGTNPASIRVREPKKIEVTVNKSAARAAGVTVPAPVLSRATRVIE
ncbi:MAG: ABC transporter substrate binding protein [Nitrospirota bacterium]|jgi:putative ABC transport system substrate-binding protein